MFYIEYIIKHSTSYITKLYLKMENPLEKIRNSIIMIIMHSKIIFNGNHSMDYFNKMSEIDQIFHIIDKLSDITDIENNEIDNLQKIICLFQKELNNVISDNYMLVEAGMNTFEIHDQIKQYVKISCILDNLIMRYRSSSLTYAIDIY